MQIGEPDTHKPGRCNAPDHDGVTVKDCDDPGYWYPVIEAHLCSWHAAELRAKSEWNERR